MLPPSIRRACQQAFVLSPKEITINGIQLTVILATMGLVRIPSIDRWIVELCQFLPHRQVDIEPLSAGTWITHYLSLAYNVGVIQGLLTTDQSHKEDIDGKKVYPSKRRRTFAVVVSGLGQVVGFSTLVSHSLVCTGSPVEQALYSLSSFLIKCSIMSLGGFLLLPKVCSIPLALVVAWSIWLERLTYQSVPGIALSNIGLAAVMTSPKEDFPITFKIGYIMMSFMPVVSTILNMWVGKNPDLGHSLSTAWLTMGTVLQRWALRS